MKKSKRLLSTIIIILSLSICFILITSAFWGKKKNKEIKIGAIFAITGPSFLGVPEAQTSKMLVEEINNKGGINGYKINLIVKDSGANPEKAISFAKQFIEEEKVLAIIGPSTSGETMQIKELCESTNTILLSCAAAESIVNPIAKYVFKTPQKDSFAAIKIFETMKKMGIKKIGVLTANTGFGNGGMAQLKKYAPQYGIDILIAETYDKAATDLTSLLTKVKAKNVQAVVNWSIVPAQSIIAKNMKQLGMDAHLFQSHGFGNIKFVKVAGEAAEGIIFPCGRLLIADSLPSSNPQKKLLVSYKNSYEKKYNEDVSTFGGHAYDALTILFEAIKKVGTDKEKVRNAIENLKNFPGTAGIFNFSASEHNGLTLDSFEMITVKDGKFTGFKK